LVLAEDEDHEWEAVNIFSEDLDLTRCFRHEDAFAYKVRHAIKPVLSSLMKISSQLTILLSRSRTISGFALSRRNLFLVAITTACRTAGSTFAGCSISTDRS
jgi:hypothetical protein